MSHIKPHSKVFVAVKELSLENQCSWFNTLDFFEWKIIIFNGV